MTRRHAVARRARPEDFINVEAVRHQEEASARATAEADRRLAENAAKADRYPPIIDRAGNVIGRLRVSGTPRPDGTPIVEPAARADAYLAERVALLEQRLALLEQPTKKERNR